MQFDTYVEKAHWQEDIGGWKLIDQDGKSYTSRFLITGIGLLSNPTLPNIPGVNDYKGKAFHTSRWPRDTVNFEGLNVGIIGVGATAIQIIPEIAKTAKSLTVFQRTPNWVRLKSACFLPCWGSDNDRLSHYTTPRLAKRKWRRYGKDTLRC